MRSRNVWRVLLVVGALALLVAAVPIGASSATDGPYGEITAPGVDEILVLGADLALGADYTDDDYDPVLWALRYGTCAAGTNTVAGNVDGYHTAFSWDGATFDASISTAGWAQGDYCFVLNPTNDAGEIDVRETRWFQLGDDPTVSCPAGQIFVDSHGSGAVTPIETVAAVAGYPYHLTVEGTFYAGGRSTYDIQADAEYSRDEYQRVNGLGWTDSVRNYEGYGEGLLEMKVDGGFVEWGAFAANHSYGMDYMATGPIGFQIYDIYAQNNTGGLCVDVEALPLRSINGGGQIIADSGDPKNPYKVSFGGHIDDIDGELVCEWQVNLHNVSNDTIDKAKFHTTDCFPLLTWEPGSGADPDSDGVTRFDANGTLNGEDGYCAIFRMEDYDEPSVRDTLRIEIYDGACATPTSPTQVFESSAQFGGDFPVSGFTNVGSARTLLDNGNIQISFYE